ncbi:isoprenylcysteine carboxylmethyltransferase family protein [Natrarchaeobius sp. A-rgal3]|uniref:methyltransferase family protein n=1 Tax=Natrarchaeobius versutus TaxID=1679078 RepID=UPI003510A5C4
MALSRTFAKTVVFTLLVPYTVAVAIPRALQRWRTHPQLPVDSTLARAAGSVSVLIGSLLYAHTAWQFVIEGRGTPSSTDEPEELVTGGIYAHVRNPMYVGVLLVAIGQALRYRSVSALWWAAGCWIGFHGRVLEYEEPHLVETYGEEYDRYCERVPRWFPRVRSKTRVR